MEPIEINQIEVKEDSQAKLDAVQNLPTKNVLFANEFNAVVDAVKNFGGSTTPNLQEVLAQELDETDVVLNDTRANKKGIEYADDYSSEFTDRSLVDKAYVDNAISNVSGGTPSLSDVMAVDSYVNGNDSTSMFIGNSVNYQDPSNQAYTNIYPGRVDIKSKNGMTISIGNDDTKNGTNGYVYFAQTGGAATMLTNSASAPTPTTWGRKGEIRYVGGYIYKCVASNSSNSTATWVRHAVETSW